MYYHQGMEAASAAVTAVVINTEAIGHMAIIHTVVTHMVILRTDITAHSKQINVKMHGSPKGFHAFFNFLSVAFSSPPGRLGRDHPVL